MAELRRKLDFTRKIHAPDVLFEDGGLSLASKSVEWDQSIASNSTLIDDRTIYKEYVLDEVATYEDGHYVLVDGEYISAVGQTTGETYSLLESTIKDKISSINTGASDLEGRVKANEDAITVINGDASVEGSIANAISKIVDSAPEAFDTLKEISDWISEDVTGTEALVKRVTDTEGELAEFEANLGYEEVVETQTYLSVDELGVALTDNPNISKIEIAGYVLEKKPHDTYVTYYVSPEGVEFYVDSSGSAKFNSGSNTVEFSTADTTEVLGKESTRVKRLEDKVTALEGAAAGKSIREIADEAIAEYHETSDETLKEWVKSAEGAKTAVYGNVLLASYPDGIGSRTNSLIENRTVVYTTIEVVDNVETRVDHTVELSSTPFTPTADGYILNAKDGTTHNIKLDTPVKVYATDVNIATAIASLENAVEVASENHELEASGLSERIQILEDAVGGTDGDSLSDRVTALEEADVTTLELINERTQYEEVAEDGVTPLTVKDKIAELQENTSITNDELAELIGSLENYLVETISHWKDNSGVVSEFVAGTTYTAVTAEDGNTSFIADVDSYVEGDNKSGPDIDLDLTPAISKVVNFTSGSFSSATYTYDKGVITVSSEGYITFVPNSNGTGPVYEALITVPEDASSRLDRVEAQASQNTSDISDIRDEIDSIKTDITKVGTHYTAGEVTLTNDTITIAGTPYSIYEYYGSNWDFTDIRLSLPTGEGIFMVLDSYAIISEVNANDDTKTVLNKVCNVLMSEDGGDALIVNNQIYDYDNMYTSARLVNAKFLTRKTV